MTGIISHLRRPGPYLRIVFVLIGSALVASIGVLDVTVIVLIAQWLSGPALYAAATLIVITLPLLIGLIPATRRIEGTAAESLLGVSFPHGTPDLARGRGDRLRSLTWLLVHLAAGALLVVALVLGTEQAVQLLTRPGWAVAGIALLLALVLLPFALGAFLAALALPLLGPSPEQRIRELEAASARLVERERLARELHDSVGHALSIVSLQSAGARERLRSGDVRAADSALESIEANARAAAAELDHALGLLRDRRQSATRPQVGLEALQALVTAAERTGLAVTTTITGDLSEVPAIVSREAYRIVQEGLTNAMRHGAADVAELDISREREGIRIEVTNPTAGRRRSAGRGVSGVGERVAVLGGVLDAGIQDDGRWRLRATLPLPRP